MKTKNSVARSTASSKDVNKKGFKLRPHVRVSVEDLEWLIDQEPCVKHLYLECAKAEQFGDHQRELTTTLSVNSFKKAAKTLQSKGLFEFEPIAGKLPSGKTGVIGYRVKNLHGSTNYKYWRINTEVEDIADENQAVTASNFDDDCQVLMLERQNLTLTEAESIDTASFENPSQPFSQEKEIKNKEKTVRDGQDEMPKLKNLRARKISGITFNLETTWQKVEECLSASRTSSMVLVTWYWEDLQDFLDVFIAEGKITHEDVELLKDKADVTHYPERSIIPVYL